MRAHKRDDVEEPTRSVKVSVQTELLKKPQSCVDFAKWYHEGLLDHGSYTNLRDRLIQHLGKIIHPTR